jgi:hypothetical protein
MNLNRRVRHIPYANAAHRSPLEEIVWVLIAGAVGFTVTTLCSGLAELRRDWFVAVYALVVALLLFVYVRWSELNIGQFLRHRWVWGVIGAVVVGAIMVLSVQRMPASPQPTGATFLWDILWLGLIYGIVDALLLTVLPVTATWRAFAAAGRTKHWPGKLAAGITAFAASLVVTGSYHLGFVEFRGPQVIDPLIGNGVMTLGYLLTVNPITAIGAHIALHTASVLHGVETTVTLPPHY